MKTRPTLAALAAAALFSGGASRVAALDFIVHMTTIDEDGYKHEQAYISNDARTSILLRPPPRWHRVDDAASLTLTPPDADNCLVRLEKSSLAPDTPFDDKGLDTYRRCAQSGIPQGATGVQCSEEHDQPLPIFGWKDHEFIFTYEFYGQSFKRSVLFINLDAREQIMTTFMAPKDHFDGLRNAGLDVLRSWQIVPAK